MKQGSNTTRLITLMLLLFTVIAGWSYYHMVNIKRSAIHTSIELSDCLQLAAEIKTMERDPQRAQSDILAHTDLTRRIEGAAGSVNISSDSLNRIDALPPRPVSKLPYEEHATRVSMDQVTLPQIVGFLHRLSNQTQDLTVKELKLTAPRGEEVGNSWQVDATLSYFIYKPVETD